MEVLRGEDPTQDGGKSAHDEKKINNIRRGETRSINVSEDPKLVMSLLDPDKPPPAPAVNMISQSPPAIIEMLSNQIKRKETQDHNGRVCSEYLADLEMFIKNRLGDKVKLNIPSLSSDYRNLSNREMMERMTEAGWRLQDSRRLERTEISAAIESMAVLHAAGLAYRMSIKTNFETKYPWLTNDLFTSNIAKELIAKHLDSYLHCLSFVSGAEKVVCQLRRIQPNVFQHLLALRRPTDDLGSRFSTICHGDLWQGNIMFRPKEEEGGQLECAMMDFHSACYLSPASDLAHLVLTSCPRNIVTDNQDWDTMVQEYYNIFNTTLARFGLVLRHLGTSYNHFKQEVSRALAGQFLVVAVVIPILAMFGPQEFDKIQSMSTRRKSASFDRENTIRHLIQMMAIVETDSENSDDAIDDDDYASDLDTKRFFQDPNLSNFVTQLLQIADDLKILETIGQECRPRSSSWVRTKQTTAKYKPTYRDGNVNRSSAIGTCG